MKTLDRVLAWVLLAFGLLHTAASVLLMSRNLNLNSAWFFAGGLAVIFGAFLNLIRNHRPADTLIAQTSVVANLLLLVLGVLLCWVLRHNLKGNPQAAVFIPLIALELLFSVRQWLR
jgi:hypothetical protein